MRDPAAPRLGDWMQTYTGRQFWPMDPDPEEIDIEDIAHALSLQCRYAGHCRWHYSIAQHSVLLSYNASSENKLWALLHDATEAYLVDVPRPVKPFLEGYQDAERVLEIAIAWRFRLPIAIPEEVKRLDTAILADEAAVLMPNPPKDWNLPYPPLGIDIKEWSPSFAKELFLEQFHWLTKERAA